MITIVSKDLKENTTKKYTQVSCSEAWGFYILCLFVEKARGKIVYCMQRMSLWGAVETT